MFKVESYRTNSTACSDALPHGHYWNGRKSNKDISFMADPLPDPDDEDIPELEGRAIYTNLNAVGVGAISAVIGKASERKDDIWFNYLRQDSADGESHGLNAYTPDQLRHFLNPISNKNYFYNGRFSGFRTITDSLVFCFGNQLPKSMSSEDDPNQWWLNTIGYLYGLEAKEFLALQNDEYERDLFQFQGWINQQNLLLGWRSADFYHLEEQFESDPSLFISDRKDANNAWDIYFQVIPKNMRILLDYRSIWIAHGMVVLHTQ